MHQALLSCLPLETRAPWASAGTEKTFSNHHQVHWPRSRSPFGYPGADVGCPSCNCVSTPRKGAEPQTSLAATQCCESAAAAGKSGRGVLGRTGSTGTCWEWLGQVGSAATSHAPCPLSLPGTLASKKRFAKYLRAAVAWTPAWRPETLCASGCRMPCCVLPGGPRR